MRPEELLAERDSLGDELEKTRIDCAVGVAKKDGKDALCVYFFEEGKRPAGIPDEWHGLPVVVRFIGEAEA